MPKVCKRIKTTVPHPDAAQFFSLTWAQKGLMEMTAVAGASDSMLAKLSLWTTECAKKVIAGGSLRTRGWGYWQGSFIFERYFTWVKNSRLTIVFFFSIFQRCFAAFWLCFWMRYALNFICASLNVLCLLWEGLLLTLCLHHWFKAVWFWCALGWFSSPPFF